MGQHLLLQIIFGVDFEQCFGFLSCYRLHFILHLLKCLKRCIFLFRNHGGYKRLHSTIWVTTFLMLWLQNSVWNKLLPTKFPTAYLANHYNASILLHGNFPSHNKKMKRIAKKGLYYRNISQQTPILQMQISKPGTDWPSGEFPVTWRLIWPAALLFFLFVCF